MNMYLHVDAVSECPTDYVPQELLRPSGVPGVYIYTALFEQIVDSLTLFIGRHREPEMEVLRFPPVMSRYQLESSGYLQSFPHLLGCVSCLDGGESDIRALVDETGWTAGLTATELVLAPAACYPLYALAASRGRLPAKALLFDVASYCFRQEATSEIDRFRAFRMREYVCMGTPEQVLTFRARWMSRGTTLAQQLGLEHRIAPASDPFFGRAGRIAAISQLEQSLKFELLVPVRSKNQPTACMSFNYHRDHFGTAWNLETEAGDVAHTGCVAFGMERLALALFAAHGSKLQSWPASVRKQLSV